MSKYGEGFMTTESADVPMTDDQRLTFDLKTRFAFPMS